MESSPYLIIEPTVICSLMLSVVLFCGYLIVRFTRRSQQPADEQAPVAMPEPPAVRPASEDAPPATPPRPSFLPYTRQRYLLSPAEQDFFTALRAAAPEGWHVFPQVRLANLVQVRQGIYNWHIHFGKVAQKCVDFVLCEPSELSPRLVVELDDSSHQRRDRRERDAFVDTVLAQVGLPILHVRWQRSYRVAELAAQIRTAVGRTPPHPSAAPAQPAAIGATSIGASPAPHGPAPLAASAPSTSVTAVVPPPPLAPALRWVCRECATEVPATAKYCPSCGCVIALDPA